MGGTVLMKIITAISSLFIANTLLAGQLGSSPVTTTNIPFVSIYGDLEVEPRLDALSVQFQYGIPSSLLTTTLLNGGTATTSNSEAVLATSGTAGAVAGLQSKTNLRYRSGHQADAYFTVAFTGAIAANTQQYIGILDSNNGFGVGYNGTTFGIVIRNNGVDTFTSQSNFNGDTINGAGSSGFNYNPALLNVFHIAYGWLGASIIQFQVMSSSGAWITFHTIQYPNSAAVPAIANPLLPISAQVYDPSGSNNLQLTTASWNMDIVGIESNAANRLFGVNSSVSLPTSTEKHVLTIRNQTSFNGLANKMNIQLQRFFGMTNQSLPGGTFLVNIYKNATVTATSFSSVNTNSVVAFSTAGTYSAGTGTKVLAQWVATQSWLQPQYINLPDANILLYPGETLTLTAYTDDSTATSIVGQFYWAELF